MSNVRIGHGFDVHELAGGRHLILCGVDIPFDKGCVAHSDGDVPVHALCDALLGAAALGDIGKHFPNTDMVYKGISSIELLRHVVGVLEANGYAVGNVDITVVIQEPKISSLIDQMRHNVANAMGVDIRTVSVKATTAEHLGVVGRGEGIEAHAVALIYKS